MRRADLLKEKIEFLKEHSPSSPEIPALEKSLSYSKRGRSNKSRGSNYERAIVKFLEKKFPNLKFGRTPSSGGYKKDIQSNNLRGDVVCLNDNVDFKLHMELKNHKTGWKSVQDWFKQAEEDCVEGKYPSVIMHQTLEKGKYKSCDFIMMRLEDFFSVVDYKNIVKNT